MAALRSQELQCFSPGSLAVTHGPVSHGQAAESLPGCALRGSRRVAVANRLYVQSIHVKRQNAV